MNASRIAKLAAIVALFETHLLQAQTTRDPFDSLRTNLIRAAGEEIQQIRIYRAPILDDAASEGSASSQSLPPGHITSPAMRRLYVLQPVLANIFREERVPVELLLVGLVESGYEPAAVSPAQAVGMWQFVPKTARRFGLLSDEGDFRSDVLRSTRAAARYLRSLLDQFEDWQLALAAYNAGEDRVAEAIRQAGSRDFSEIVNRRLLPDETLRYVPTVLSAIADARNHGLLKVSFPIDRQQNIVPNTGRLP